MSFRFRKFKVFQDTKSLHKQIAILANKFSPQYFYLADQLKRSSLSIVLNIAEGSSKQTDKDFNRFIAIALGSLDETAANLEIAEEFGLISKDSFLILEKELETISRQLGGLSKHLKSAEPR